MLFSPEPPPQEKCVPLILFLHGSDEGARGSDALETERLLSVGLPKLAEADKVPTSEPVYIACPQTSKGSWEEEATRVGQLVSDLAAKHPICKDRCYLTGISLGGLGCWRIAERMPDRFAAIAPVSARAYPTNATAEIPALVYHGRFDRNPYTKYEETRENLWANGIRNDANTKLKTGWFGTKGFGLWRAAHNHDYWNHVYADSELYSWLLSQPPRGIAGVG